MADASFTAGRPVARERAEECRKPTAWGACNLVAGHAGGCVDTERDGRFNVGTADTSGGRWGVPVKHAVRPGTEFTVGWARRGTAFCGAEVSAFSGRTFGPDMPFACQRCANAVRKAVA